LNTASAHGLPAIHHDGGAVATFDRLGWLLPLALRGRIDPIRQGRIEPDRWSALWTVEVVILVTKRLNLFLRCTQIEGQISYQIEQTDDLRSCVFVLHAGKIVIVHHQQTSPCASASLHEDERISAP
jgi:hypothetical protein